MRSLLVGIILSWTLSVAVTEDPIEFARSTELTRNKSKNLMKPSFVPYCVTRDVCQPVCDCAIYEECELLSMNSDVRDRILNALNQARSIQTKGEPQASGMPQLMYEMDLEEISKCWSARCQNEYSECFRTTVFNETTQTVGLLPLDLKVSEIPLNYWDRTIQIWLGEVRKTTAEVVSSLPAGKEGELVHSYAQILSDKVLKVGCAWSRLVPSGPNEQASVIFVCTFGPHGPRQGQPIYKTGKACDTCPEGYKCNYHQPFEFLCQEQSVQQEESTEAEQGRHAEIKGTQEKSEIGKDELMDYNSPFSADTEASPKSANQPQGRSAISAARVLRENIQVLIIMLLCFVKFIH